MSSKIKDLTFLRLSAPNRQKNLHLCAVPGHPYYNEHLLAYVAKVYCNEEYIEYCLEFDEAEGWARGMMFDVHGKPTNNAIEYRGPIRLLFRQANPKYKG